MHRNVKFGPVLGQSERMNDTDPIAQVQPVRMAVTMSQKDIDVDELLRHPSNSKLDRSLTGLDHLTEIVSSCGVLQKVRVRVGADGYEILYGSRRARAAKEAGHRTVPCAVTEIHDAKEIEVQLIPKMLREDSTLIDVGRAVFDLTRRHKIQTASQMLATSPMWLSRHAAIAELPSPVLNAVEAGVVTSIEAIRALGSFYTHCPAEASEIISGRMGTLLTLRGVKKARKKIENASAADDEEEPPKQGPLANLRREESVSPAMARIANRELSQLALRGTTFSRLSQAQVTEIARRFITLMENPCLPEGIRLQSLKELLRDSQNWAC